MEKSSRYYINKKALKHYVNYIIFLSVKIYTFLCREGVWKYTYQRANRGYPLDIRIRDVLFLLNTFRKYIYLLKNTTNTLYTLTIT